VNVSSPVKVCEAFANMLYYLHAARSDGSRTEIGHCQDPQNVCADSATALGAQAQVWDKARAQSKLVSIRTVLNKKSSVYMTTTPACK
jgi:hypothetical protein